MSRVLAHDKMYQNILQVFYLLSYLHQIRDINGPHLIVTPKLMVDCWVNKINSIIPNLKTVKYLDLKTEDPFAQFGSDICIAKESKLPKIEWCYTIVDHIHLVLKENTMLSKTLMSIESKN